MRVFKVVFLIIASVLALFVCLIAWAFFTIEVWYPIQHARLQVEAEKWNTENWETGSALRVTVQISSGETLDRELATATLDCYRRQFAQPGGLKGPPRAPKVVKSDGPEYLIVPFGPSAALYTPLRHVCYEALREHKDWQLPHVTSSYDYGATIVAHDRSFSCFLGNDPRTSQAQATRPVFVDVEEIPLRSLLSINDYRGLPDWGEVSSLRLPQTHYWWIEEEEKSCWRKRRDDACDPNVEQVCGTPIR